MIYASSASNVWAVGISSSPTADQTLILRWDGAAWTQVPTPNPSGTFNELSAVGASSATDIWAVGTTQPSPQLAYAIHCC